MVTCPDSTDTTNMPALIEDTRPETAENYHQERRAAAYKERRAAAYIEMLYLRTFAPVNYGVNHNRNNIMEEVD